MALSSPLHFASEMDGEIPKACDTTFNIFHAISLCSHRAESCFYLLGISCNFHDVSAKDRFCFSTSLDQCLTSHSAKNAFYTNKWPFSKMWICARWPSYLGQHKQKQTSSCDLEVLDPLQLRCLYSAARVARALENSSLMVSKWKIM